MASYTVTVGSRVVQFREKGNTLNGAMLALAKKAHPDVVAGCDFHGLIGGPEDEKALSVYSMPNLLGGVISSSRVRWRKARNVD